MGRPPSRGRAKLSASINYKMAVQDESSDSELDLDAEVKRINEEMKTLYVRADPHLDYLNKMKVKSKTLDAYKVDPTDDVPANRSKIDAIKHEWANWDEWEYDEENAALMEAPLPSRPLSRARTSVDVDLRHYKEMISRRQTPSRQSLQYLREEMESLKEFKKKNINATPQAPKIGERKRQMSHRDGEPVRTISTRRLGTRTDLNFQRMGVDYAAVNIEEGDLGIGHLQLLRRLFDMAIRKLKSTRALKEDALDRESFAEAFSPVLQLPKAALYNIFDRIDYNADNSLTCEEFLEFVSAEGMSRWFETYWTYRFEPLKRRSHDMHRGMIHRIIHMPKRNLYLTCGYKSLVHIWDAKDLVVTHHLPLPSASRYMDVSRGQLSKTLRSVNRAKNVDDWKQKGGKANMPTNSSLVMDVIYCQKHDVFVVVVDNTLYKPVIVKFSTRTYNEVGCEPLRYTPTCVEVAYIPAFDTDVCMVGHENGAVTLYEFATWNFLREVHPHTAAVTKVAALPLMGVRQLVSSSLDSVVKVTDMTRFDTVWDGKNHIKGISSFSYSKVWGVLATAGLDRRVCLWNSFVRKPIAVLVGHAGPVKEVLINDALNHIVSLSVDKTVKVWDLRSFRCVQTLRDPCCHLPRNETYAMLFDSQKQCLVTGGSYLGAWPLDSTRDRQAHQVGAPAHCHPVVGVKFSPAFNQVVSVDAQGSVRVWDFDTGSLVGEFEATVDTVTAVGMDSTYRKLLVGTHTGMIYSYAFNTQTLLVERALVAEEKEDFTSSGLPDTIEALAQPKELQSNSPRRRRRRPLSAKPSSPPHDTDPDSTGGGKSSRQSHVAKVVRGAEIGDIGFLLGSTSRPVIAVTSQPSIALMPVDDADSGLSPVVLRPHAKDVTAVCVCDESRAVTGDAEGLLLFWNIIDGNLVKQPKVRASVPHGVVSRRLTVDKIIYLQRYKMIAVGLGDGTIHLYQSNTALLVAECAVRSGGSLTAAATDSPNNRRFFAGDVQGHIRVWRIVPLQKQVLRGKEKFVRRASVVSPPAVVEPVVVEDKPKFARIAEATFSRSRVTVGGADAVAASVAAGQYLHVRRRSLAEDDVVDGIVFEPIADCSAHIGVVTSLDYCSAFDGFVSSGVDGHVRLWTHNGDPVASLGQEDPWPLQATEVAPSPTSSRSHSMLSNATDAKETKDARNAGVLASDENDGAPRRLEQAQGSSAPLSRRHSTRSLMSNASSSGTVDKSVFKKPPVDPGLQLILPPDIREALVTHMGNADAIDRALWQGHCRATVTFTPKKRVSGSE
eukprot:Rmarinus@m.16743